MKSSEGGPRTIIWEMDARAGRFTYVSASAERLLGYPLSRWRNPEFIPEYVHPEDRERVCAARLAAAETLADTCIEYRAISADGRTVWLRDRIGVISGPDGRARLLHGVMTDVTRQKATERQLAVARDVARRAAVRLRGIANASPAILAADSFDRLYGALADAAREIARPDAFGIALPAGEEVRWRTGAPDAEPEERTIALAGSAFEAAILQNHSVVFTEQADIARRPPLSGRYGAGVIVPIRRGESSLGAIAAFAARNAAYDEQDQAALETLAALAAPALAALAEQHETGRVRRALRTSESLNRLLLRVTAAANQAHGFTDAAAVCLDAIGRHAGWQTGHVLERAETGEFIAVGVWDRDTNPAFRRVTAPATVLRHAQAGSVVGHATRTGEPVWIADLDAEPGYHAARRTCVRAIFALPVIVESEVAAVLEFASPDVKSADAALLELAPQLGTQLGHVIGRERADARIRFQASMLDVIGEAVIASDVRHRIIYWNAAAEALYGWTADEVIGRTDSEVLPSRATAEQTAEITARLAAGQNWSGEFMVARKDGVEVPVRVTGSTIEGAGGAPIAYVTVSADLRRSRQLEQRLRQAQRLEAIGRLAGGVAHDFNNLLTSIKGSAQLVLDDLDPASPLRPEIEEIGRAAERAVRLTSQLLAFSRRQIMRPRIIAAAELVRGMEPVLRRLAGSAVDLVIDADPDAGSVNVDPAQLEQAILNLVANARDAIQRDGRITVRTRATELDTARSAALSTTLQPGRYVAIDIEDTGPGLEPDQLDLIFDPFYTTKDRASGIGLGLSTAYGIVRQSDGHITVASEPGRGARFTILLPRVDGTATTTETAGEPGKAATGRETLLLVDDEPAVRRLARKVLDRKGYTVLEAADGIEALDILDRHDGRIDLVISDVIMPRMGGGELAARIASTRPDLPVLLVSGYTDEPGIRSRIAHAGSAFLEKPFTPETLTSAVRSILDKAGR